MTTMAYEWERLARDGIPPLLQGIESAEQWRGKEREIAAIWLDYLGEMPERGAVHSRLVSETKLRTHTRRHIRYTTADGDEVTAHLLLPAGYEERGGGDPRLPAIIALHPTNKHGKDDIATVEGRENRRYALELVERGYVVLAPDTITAGERIDTEPYHTATFYERHPTWTAAGKMLVDHMYGVDLLAGLDGVDPERIGAIGHSLGAYNAFFLAGVDKRIRAFVSSCGFSPFTGDHRPNRWGRRDWFTHIPRLTDDLEAGEVPFEFHEIAALAAPAAGFYWSGQADHIFPHWREISEGMAQVAELYKLLQAEERFCYVMGGCGHDFPEYARVAAYWFLDRWLLQALPNQEEG